MVGAEGYAKKKIVKEYYFQHPDVYQKIPRPDPRALAGPWYLLKSEIVGVESCPVHGHGEGEGRKYRKDKKVIYYLSNVSNYLTRYFYSAWYNGPCLWTG